MTVLVIADTGVATAGAVQFPNSGSVNAASDGTFAINQADLAYALGAGYVQAHKHLHHYATPFAPAAATADAIVSSATLADGALVVAAQPDVMRQVLVTVTPDSSAITAGTLTLVYAANDGTADQTDVLSLVHDSSSFTAVSSKGALTVASATVADLAGGGMTPTIEVGTTAALAVPVPVGAVDVTILKEITDVADTSDNLGTLDNTGIWTPHSAPDGMHTYAVAYTTIAP